MPLFVAIEVKSKKGKGVEPSTVVQHPNLHAPLSPPLIYAKVIGSQDCLQPRLRISLKPHFLGPVESIGFHQQFVVLQHINAEHANGRKGGEPQDAAGYGDF